MNLLLILRSVTLLMAMNHLLKLYTTSVDHCPVMNTISKSFNGAKESDLTERWTVCDSEGK